MPVSRLFPLNCLTPPKFHYCRCTYYRWPVILCSASTSSSGKAVVQTKATENLPSTNVTIRVKQATKDVGYFTIVIGGLALTGAILYTIVQELFSSKSSNGVYNDAFKICKSDNRVLNLLGSSIKAHGDPNSRGRRRNIAHDSWYDDKGRLHMAMKFHLDGNLASGVVHLEVVENESKEFEYRYLVLETDAGFSKKQIILRSSADLQNPT